VSNSKVQPFSVPVVRAGPSRCRAQCKI